MERVEQGDGQVIGAEPTFFVVAVEEDDGGITCVTFVVRVDHSRHGIGHAALVEGGLSGVPQVPGIETTRGQRGFRSGVNLV